MPPHTPESSPSAFSGSVRPPEHLLHSGPVELAEPQPPQHRRGRRLGGTLTVAVFTIVGIAAGTLAYVVTRPPQRTASVSGVSSAASAPQPGGGTGALATGQSSGAPSRSAQGQTPPQQSNVAMPVGDLPGWRQTFTEDFSGTGLGSKWYAYEGQPGGDPGGWWKPSHVVVGGGNLVLKGYREQTPHGSLYTTGGVSNHNVFTQLYGRFDIRFRMDKGPGVAYALLLWPSSDRWPPEIDIVEDNGSDRMKTSATMHYGADNKMIFRETAGDFSQWHTASVEWTPGHLVYKIDGMVWTTIDTPDVPAEPMDIALQTQAWACGTPWEVCPNSNTPTEVNLHVDWVVAYKMA